MKKIGKVLLIGLGIMIVVVCMVFYETIIILNGLQKWFISCATLKNTLIGR